MSDLSGGGLYKGRICSLKPLVLHRELGSSANAGGEYAFLFLLWLLYKKNAFVHLDSILLVSLKIGIEYLGHDLPKKV